MKLLFITGNPVRYGISNFDFLASELKTMVDLNVWVEPAELKDIFKYTGRPDFILINEPGEGFTPDITGIEKSPVPLGIYLSDLQHDIASRKKFIEDADIKYIFSRYRDRFYEWYPQFFDRLIWLPQHVNQLIFKNYGQIKDIDCLITGWIDEEQHPVRKKVIDSMQNWPGFVSHIYPCSDINSEERYGMTQAGVWARQINRAKICFTCDTICRFPLSTYYAVLACNTLLMAPVCRELKDLGFVDGKHFVAINEHINIAEKAEYYLTHDQERMLIAHQGRNMVARYHNTRIRARQLVEVINCILRGDPVPRSAAKTIFP